jgi:hypothetical protein
MNKKAKNKSVPCFDMQFITSSISTTLVLLLLGLVVFFVLGAHNLSVYVKENINFSILISDDMKESDILKLQKKLDKEPFVKETEYISKKQALREQTEAMGTDPQEFLGYNPFTASIEIKLHSGYANSDSVKEKWMPYFRMSYQYADNEITLSYARWNEKHQSYDKDVRKSVYEMNAENMPVAYKSNRIYHTVNLLTMAE